MVTWEIAALFGLGSAMVGAGVASMITVRIMRVYATTAADREAFRRAEAYHRKWLHGEHQKRFAHAYGKAASNDVAAEPGKPDLYQALAVAVETPAADYQGSHSRDGLSLGEAEPPLRFWLPGPSSRRCTPDPGAGAPL